MWRSFQSLFSIYARWMTLAVCCVSGLIPLTSAQDALAENGSTRPEIEQRLAAARDELRNLSDSDPALHDRLQQLSAACQFNLTAVGTLEKAQKDQALAAANLQSWSGFTQQAPYSILLLDDVRERLAMLQNSKSGGDAQVRIFTAEMESSRDRLDAHQQAERRFAEEAAHAPTPEARDAAARSARLESIASRIAAEMLARQTLLLAAQRAELEMFQSQSELAKLQLAELQGKTRMSPQDFQSIQQRIAADRVRALAALTQASESETPPNPLLAWEIEFLDLENEFWTHRHEALNPPPSFNRKGAIASLGEMKARVDDWMEIAHLRFSGGSLGIVASDPDHLQSAIQRSARLQRLIAFTIADLEGGHLKTPVFDRLSATLISLWNTELYLAEEVEIVDNKKTSTYRAVTLGKLIRLIGIIAVGWFILRSISRKVKAMISRRPHFSPASADLAAKAASILGMILLVIYGLNTVRIPLTALAFLGGALAIGIGFGTQNLLKNFISGLILIFERPLKVGDVIDLDGTTGTIKFIGIRASVIQHFDGIETLVPNSILLENQLTNWTFSNPVIRHFILVGVAYGSPTREVAKILLQVADDHGLVLDDPAPEVRFEDFGADSLVFRLLFWLDTTKTGRDPLASDLRFMIDKAFASSGIVIAYPQRDLHFDRETPLRVELSRSPGTPPAPKESNT